MAKRGGIAKRDVGKVVDRETSSETDHHDVRGSSESEGSGPSNAAIKTGGKHPKTILMIIEAIDELGEKKGSDPDSIMSYILGQYQDLDEKRFKLLFKRALLKGITDGVLLRTKLTEQCEGVTGRFEVAPAKPKLARKPKDALAKSDKAPEFQAAGDVGKPSGSGLPKAAAAAKLQKKVAKKAEDAPESGAVKARVVRQHRQSALYEYKGQYQDLDEKRFKLLFKRALLKGITDGVLLRTKLTEQCEGVTGRFEVAPAKPKLARKPKDALAKSDKAPEFQAAGDVGKPSGSGLPKAAAAAKLQKKVAKKAEDAPESGAVKARVVRQHRQSALYEYKGGVPQAPKDVVKRMSLRKDAAAHEEGVQPRKVAEAGKKVVVPLRRQPARATKM
ncbi:putative histone H1 [Ixodes scapularis]